MDRALPACQQKDFVAAGRPSFQVYRFDDTLREWRLSSPLEKLMAAEKMRVLIAEDSSIVRSLYVACLENAGFEVHQSTDGKRALAMVSVLKPQLLLADITMPDLDGITLIQRMRSHEDETVRRIPVILVTASEDSSSRQQAALVGAARFLNKPVTAAQLLESIQQVLGENGKR
jgi:CheY-like chemotaxis protein